MWNNSKPKTSSYFSDYNGRILARAVRGKPSEKQSYPLCVTPANQPTRSPLPLRMVISDMARRRNLSSQTITNLPQPETFTSPDPYLQEPRDMYSETQNGLSPDNFPCGMKNKNPFEKIRNANITNDMRKKFNLMYGNANDTKDEIKENSTQINEADQTLNPQKLKFTQLYRKRPTFPPPNMLSFAEFVERVNKKSSIMTPQKRSWADESFDGRADSLNDSTSSSSEVNRSNRNSQQSWKKRYLSTEIFLHSIQEEWPDSEDQNDSVPISSDAEGKRAPEDSSDDAMDVRKRKAGIFDDLFEISAEKKNRFAPSPPLQMFSNADGGGTSGEESDTCEAVLNEDIDDTTTGHPFYEDLLNVCSQDSIYSDDSNDAKKATFSLNNIQLYDAE